MFGAILKATNSSFQKGITFCRSIYVKKAIKLLAFIFEQPSYLVQLLMHFGLQVIVFYLIFNQCPGLVVYVSVLCSFYFGTHLAQGTPK